MKPSERAEIINIGLRLQAMPFQTRMATLVGLAAFQLGNLPPAAQEEGIRIFTEQLREGTAAVSARKTNAKAQ